MHFNIHTRAHTRTHTCANTRTRRYNIVEMTPWESAVWVIGSIANIMCFVLAWVYVFDSTQLEIQDLDNAQEVGCGHVCLCMCVRACMHACVRVCRAHARVHQSARARCLNAYACACTNICPLTVPQYSYEGRPHQPAPWPAPSPPRPLKRQAKREGQWRSPTPAPACSKACPPPRCVPSA